MNDECHNVKSRFRNENEARMIYYEKQRGLIS
jgi:hypothetical protein